MLIKSVSLVCRNEVNLLADAIFRHRLTNIASALLNSTHGYLECWRSTPECPLSDRQLDDLFNNILDIYNFNSGFLRELEQCGLEPVRVARTFVKNNSGFSIYTEYCTNYPRTVSVLTELMRQEATVRLFRERQTALQHTLPLGSYLLKPVQRILKYHLLLQVTSVNSIVTRFNVRTNIVKHYVHEAEGYSDIVEALSAMTGIAHHINNMKRRHEHAVRVQEIQSLLYGWEGEDLTTFGELCAEGTFRMSGAKALRHAFLFDKMLLITKKKEEGILGYKTHIMVCQEDSGRELGQILMATGRSMLESCTECQIVFVCYNKITKKHVLVLVAQCSNLMLIESVPGEPFSFHVIPFDNPRLQHTLQARNLEQKREWTLQLKRVILENYNAVIPSHARQLVMELGQNRTDGEQLSELVMLIPADEILADKSTPKRQHSAPEYLEKRKQERDRRKSETGLRYRLRRSRKSDAGSVTESPMSHRRGRRASSSNRDRSESREDTRSASPTKIKVRKLFSRRDRFGSWRRKSEPGCHATSPVNKGSPKDSQPKLSVAGGSCDLNASAGLLGKQAAPSSCEGGSREDINFQSCEDVSYQSCENIDFQSQETVNDSEKVVSCAVTPCDTEEAKTLEEIVGQLLMQNREFQKILKKQQRHVSQRNRAANFNSPNKDETTDEEDGIYETLVSAPGNPAGFSRATQGQSYRAHRQAHMKALRNEQKTTSTPRQSRYETTSPNVDEDYVTLLCHRNGSNNVLLDVKGQSDGLTLKSRAKSADPLRGDISPTNDCNVKRNSIWVQGDHKASGRSNCEDPDGFGNYDNLEHIWETVRRQQEEIQNLADGVEGNLRRTNSFHTANSSPLCLPPSASLIPNLPAVWLKQQGEHLATHSNKSGSLPRSFQVGNETDRSSTFKPRLLTRDGRPCSDRPFTIASDKPPEINFDDIERYIEQSGTSHIRNRFPLHGDTTEDDSTTEYTATPNQSLNELNVHPDYKIYRPSMSKASLRHVISSVSSRLAGLRTSSETLDADIEQDRILQRERRASKLVHALARQYGRTLRQRIKHIMGEESEEVYDRPASPAPTTPCNSALPTYKQGSSGMGARIAHCSEYANPRLLYPNIEHKANLDTRPESVMSISSNVTSSSEGDKTSGRGSMDTNKLPLCSSVITATTTTTQSITTVVASPSSEDIHFSDGSADSYYERSFEAIECLMENDIFRDSAVFSDQDDYTDTAGNTETVVKDLVIPSVKRTPSLSSVRLTKTGKVPPPVPVKPEMFKSRSVSERLKNLEETTAFHREEHLVRSLEGISKSVQERRRELEQWKALREDDASSQHSTASTVIEVSPVKDSPDDEGGAARGWVKHVIGKLQGEPNEMGLKHSQCQ
uniref:DH domain-containing protein n=1 Tax=Timema tahoe TaxID=61484 RepID=A0A7R9FJS9_9NEOP|nr:unnamed protein product [Timema tahoe]